MKLSENKINLIYITVLAIICMVLFLPSMAGYPFIDDEESKFATIAKEMLNNSDWINIKLSGKNVFALSPLYFWIVNISCVIFGKISAETIRLPIALFAATGILGLYFITKSLLAKNYAFITSLIFACSFGIIIFSRLATNDILFTVFSMFAVLFGYFAVISTKKSALKLFMAYLFSALAVLTGGLFGIIPLISILIMYSFSGSLKELFKPQNILPGLLVFLIFVLPWHILMFYKHGTVYVWEFLDGYNILKFAGIKQTFIMLFSFILAFSPWIFSFLWILGSRMKDISNSVISYFKDNSDSKLKEKWNKLKKIDKFVSINTIVFFTYLFFALLYGEKYTFLILLLIFPAACISGHYWYEYIIKNKHHKSIFFATIIPNLIMIICSLIGLFGHNVLNRWLFQELNYILIPLILIFFVIPVIGIFSVIVRGKKVPFAADIILMISLSFVITPNIFNFICSNEGEADLISYAGIARRNNAELAAYISEKKYSLEYYYDKPVKDIKKLNVNELREYMKVNPETYVVVEIKDMFSIEENKISYQLLETGKRYCLIKYMQPVEEELTAV